MINVAWLLFSVGNAVAFVVGASLFFSGALTIGTVYLIFHYTNLISQPLERIARVFEQFQRAGARHRPHSRAVCDREPFGRDAGSRRWRGLFGRER